MCEKLKIELFQLVTFLQRYEDILGGKEILIEFPRKFRWLMAVDFLISENFETAKKHSLDFQHNF